ncbi:ABC transporter permease [Agrococcus carbonis]|uniref:Transport permease protein n=1 Tax=Agrococcus carbonis TaxID=684552 RepID=A0A1H1RIY8_9MICO|nr:ABC transporter permease [Agrococcus carbonis]SDS35675.1 teichoic acid transport system permease protein [Agrococcus carbonis]
MTSTPPRAESKGLRTQWRRAWSTRKAGASALSAPLRRELQTRYGDLSHLRRVGTRPPLREYFTELFDRRHFIWAGARGEALTRYSNERLGMAWYILRPLLDAAFYWVIFGVILNISQGMENYTAFILIGVFMFQISSRAITGGVSLVKNSKAMIRAFAFPRASLGISMVLRDLMSSAPAILIMIVLIVAIPPHEAPNVAWSLFPIILALQVAMSLGFVFFFGWLGALMPDLAQAMSFVSRLLMYGSAVIFPIERFVDHPAILAIIQLNPIYVALDMYRMTLISGAVPPFENWLQLAAWAIGGLVVGFTLFWWNEERYGRE